MFLLHYFRIRISLYHFIHIDTSLVSFSGPDGGGKQGSHCHQAKHCCGATRPNQGVAVEVDLFGAPAGVGRHLLDGHDGDPVGELVHKTHAAVHEGTGVQVVADQVCHYAEAGN